MALTGAPILSAACHCESCRTAGHAFERTPGAPQTVNLNGGVDYCLYRKDRMRIVQGARHLQEHRLRPDSPTRRVVAGCCGSPMFVDFTRGHWVTIYRDRLGKGAPRPQMRVMTGDRPEGPALPNDIPAYKTMPPIFMVKLIAAWAAMAFRRPKIVW